MEIISGHQQRWPRPLPGAILIPPALLVVADCWHPENHLFIDDNSKRQFQPSIHAKRFSKQSQLTIKSTLDILKLCSIFLLHQLGGNYQ